MKYDINDDGKLSAEEIALENQDKKEDSQRKMAWVALIGMVTYPLSIVIASAAGLGDAAKVMGEMAPVYFLSVAGIVAAFYGKEAYTKNKEK